MNNPVQPMADIKFIKQVTKVDQVRLEELLQDTSILMWEMFNTQKYEEMDDFLFLWFMQIIHKHITTIHDFFYPGKNFLEDHVIKDEKYYLKFIKLMTYDPPVFIPSLEFDYDRQSYRRRKKDVPAPPVPPF